MDKGDHQPAALIRAYHATDYEVHAPQAFVLHIDEESEPLLSLYRKRNCNCAAYLTAWNPRSRLLTDAENRAAQELLEKILQALGYQYVPGKGVDPSGKWPGEGSVLVPGLPLAEAEKLAGRFRQNAFLWAGADAVPRLMLIEQASEPMEPE